MPTAYYYEPSFNRSPWQHIIDVNAALIEIPLDTLSAGLSGFAFENVDGTHSVFLSHDVVVGGGGDPVGGTVLAVLRLSSLQTPVEPELHRRRRRLVLGLQPLCRVSYRRSSVSFDPLHRRRHSRDPKPGEPRRPGAKPADRDLPR